MNTNRFSNIFIVLFSLISVFMINSCEDDIPNDYIPAVFVEGYLIVDEPIRGILVQSTQPVSDSFDYDYSMIRDARVRVFDTIGSYSLKFSNDSIYPGYYYPDESLLVQPNRTYNLEIILNDGTVITGKTTTPGRMKWIKGVQPYIQYPYDTLKLPPQDSLNYEWENQSTGFKWYLIRVNCLDTLEYGTYINKPEERNRRTYKPFANGQSRSYKDPVVWGGPLGNNKTPFIWNILKWYGRHELAVYQPDLNFLKWFLHIQRRAVYEPLLASMNGAMGVFGSASVLYDTTFILKNQP